jgi:hypothetical protein
VRGQGYIVPLEGDLAFAASAVFQIIPSIPAEMGLVSEVQ